MRTSCAVVGAGPAGLAVSRQLAERGVGHVLLERDEVGSTWRHQRWDSFRLNTPDWMNTMLGEMEPGAFLGRDEVVERLGALAGALPVRTRTPVESLVRHDGGFRLTTQDDLIETDTVVIASGMLNVPKTPAAAREMPAGVLSISAAEYRSADQLPAGAVLVVGGAQSGIQIAEDLTLAGRRVLLSTCRVGRFNWSYRGREMFSWLDDVGFWAQRPADLDDPGMMRMPQPLVASGGRSLSLPMVADLGVTLLGRLTTVSNGQVAFDESAPANVIGSNQFWQRMCGMVDQHVEANGIDAPSPDGDEGGGDPPADAPTVLDLAEADVSTVIWCTGFTGDLSWADLPLVDEFGQVRRVGNASEVPGLWFAGFPWLLQRKSGILYGFPVDAAQTVDEITRHLADGRA